ncbi:MAG: Hsp20/alpha crystallin family protein [Desulfobacterales bacterium]|nr:Hsp20/alpha crystallin family protein [Desulfobacterales bacterium]
MPIIRWREPNYSGAVLDQLQKEMNKLFQDFFGESVYHYATRTSAAGVFPLINVTEDKEKIYVRAELPGINAEGLDITATGDSLSISGERKIVSEGDNVKYHRREREAGKFSRKFNLGKQIDSNKVEAKFIDGILTVVLPKSENSKPKQITINK